MKNKSLFIVLGAIVFIILIVGFSIAGTYNNLVSAKGEVDAKQAAISTQLQRRSDLIPNLVNTVKGYAAHEKQVFTDVANARARLAGATTINETQQANNQLSGALGRLLAIAEAYPELKANQNFIALQDELTGTENRIAVARRDYNEVAKNYNVRIRRFPSNIFAGMFGFTAADYFEADEGANQVPNVEF